MRLHVVSPLSLALEVHATVVVRVLDLRRFLHYLAVMADDVPIVARLLDATLRFDGALLDLDLCGLDELDAHLVLISMRRRVHQVLTLRVQQSLVLTCNHRLL